MMISMSFTCMNKNVFNYAKQPLRAVKIEFILFYFSASHDDPYVQYYVWKEIKPDYTSMQNFSLAFWAEE